MVVALLGLGNVGRAVYRVLSDANNEINKRYAIKIKYILVRSLDKDIRDKELLTQSYADIINDSEVDCVIEMMDSEISYRVIYEALAHSKHVITANKEVIAAHYVDLMEVGMANGATLLFEASVAGGIPIINSLLRMSEYNKISGIEGILNGTTNFILTSMHQDKLELSEALRMAQQRGLAEANPKNDLEGLDMVRKLLILSMIAYDSRIDIDKIYHNGILDIDKDIISFIDLLGYRLKLLAKSELKDNNISLLVTKALVKEGSIMSSVSYEDNLVSITGDVSDRLVLTGKGAGEATANAILYDLSLLLAGYRNSFIPKNSYPCTANDTICANYLVREINKIPDKYVKKRIGNMVITTKITGLELKSLLPNLSFSAIFID